MGCTITNQVGMIRVVEKPHLICTLVLSLGLKKYTTYDMLGNVSVLHFHIYEQNTLSTTQFVICWCDFGMNQLTCSFCAGYNIRKQCYCCETIVHEDSTSEYGFYQWDCTDNQSATSEPRETTRLLFEWERDAFGIRLHWQCWLGKTSSW